VFDEQERVALVRHTYGDHWYFPGGGVMSTAEQNQASGAQ
jgi:8-oxo-dGTP pyrophosphatase MutT (NUDIX family)